MHTISLISLVTFLSVFALINTNVTHAADSPTLTTYTVSQDTIYPTASVESGLATTTSIDTAFSEQVKVSIKIISVSGITMKSLYTSSGVTNPTPKIWDGTNTSGAHVENGTYTILISATSTATSQLMTDSSKTITVASPPSSSSNSSNDENSEDNEENVVVTQTNTAPTEYLPIPILNIVAAGDRTISSGADVAFNATVYGIKGNKRDDAVVTWSFGDGMRRTGANVFHKYYYPGVYIAVVHATTSDGGDVKKEMIITVKNAGINISSVSARGITLSNNDSRTLDISFWKLSMGGQEFKIPENTQILAGREILFPSQIIELPFADSASLLYPSGEVAVTYPTKPFTNIHGYKDIQTVEPIISTKANSRAYDEEVKAPAATTKSVEVAGAVSPFVNEMVDTNGSNSTSAFSKILHSPWTIGFLSIVALAGGAFIFI